MGPMGPRGLGPIKQKVVDHHHHPDHDHHHHHHGPDHDHDNPGPGARPRPNKKRRGSGLGRRFFVGSLPGPLALDHHDHDHDDDDHDQDDDDITNKDITTKTFTKPLVLAQSDIFLLVQDFGRPKKKKCAFIVFETPRILRKHK